MSAYLYSPFDFMFLSCHLHVSELFRTLCQETPCSKNARILVIRKFSDHNILEFVLFVLLLLLYCMSQMLREIRNIHRFFNNSVLVNNFSILPMKYLQKENYMFKHVVELHVVDLTCKNLHDSETPVMLRIRI